MSKESAPKNSEELALRLGDLVMSIDVLSDPKKFTGLQVSGSEKGKPIWIAGCGCDKCN